MPRSLKVLISIYVFEDFDRLHKLTLSYRVMESDKWAADLQAVLKSVNAGPIVRRGSVQ
jgi:hypothetical protein